MGKKKSVRLTSVASDVDNSNHQLNGDDEYDTDDDEGSDDDVDVYLQNSSLADYRWFISAIVVCTLLLTVYFVGTDYSIPHFLLLTTLSAKLQLSNNIAVVPVTRGITAMSTATSVTVAKPIEESELRPPPPVPDIHKDHSDDDLDGAAFIECNSIRRTYGILPGRSWGNLSRDGEAHWRSLGCDDALNHRDTILRDRHRTRRLQIQRPPHTIQTPSAEQAARYKKREADGLPKEPVIAISVCTTTRFIFDPITSFDQLALFHVLLPSLVATAEAGYEYNVYIVYDIGDLYYDQTGRSEQITLWFNENISKILYSTKNIISRIYLLPFDNIRKKPGPAFNFLLNQAYIDGSDFFYRINDDSSMLTPWADALVKQVLSYGWPYGAVGPRCDAGNTRILTHDLTHRTHLDIFSPNYYPAALEDWFLDDWITLVYGRKRTKRVREIEVGHFSAHGTRYVPDTSKQNILNREVQEGKQKILKAMRDKGLSQTIIDTYDQDSFSFMVNGD